MAEKMFGTVSRFNSTKGYGFIKPEQGGGDLFVHQTSIHCQGFRTLYPGQSVEYYLVQEEDGRYKADDVTVLGEEEEEEEDTMAVKSTGKVMRFDSTKGYGFIKPEESEEEVFVHQTSILCEGFRTLNIGESVEFFVTQGNDGRTRAAHVTVLDKRSRRRETEECHTCGEVGHYSKECAQKVSGNVGSGRSFDGSCHTRGGIGHMARDCPSPPTKKEKEPVVCFTCNRPGHISRDCKRGAKGKASGGKANGGGKASGGNGGGKASGGSDK